MKRIIFFLMLAFSFFEVEAADASASSSGPKVPSQALNIFAPNKRWGTELINKAIKEIDEIKYVLINQDLDSQKRMLHNYQIKRYQESLKAALDCIENDQFVIASKILKKLTKEFPELDFNNLQNIMQKIIEIFALPVIEVTELPNVIVDLILSYNKLNCFEPIQLLEDHNRLEFVRVEFVYSQHPKYTVTGILSREIAIWNKKSGKVIQFLSNLGGIVESACFSPDGRYFVGTFNNNKTVKIWAVPEENECYAGEENVDGYTDVWECIQTLENYENYIFKYYDSICFSSDGRYLAIRSLDNIVKKMWERSLGL